jgi:cell cycle sensor histidine kinase DivJ
MHASLAPIADFFRAFLGAGKVAPSAPLAAEERRSQYRLLAEYATDMITRHGANGDVEFASPAATTLIGVPAANLLGDRLARHVHIADRPAYLTALSRAFNSATPTAAEFRLRRSVGEGDGDRFVPVEMRCRPALDLAGLPRSVIAVTRDVSERKAYEGELRSAREAAERANIAKTQFLANMSHELRTPLNAIIGFSEILENEAIGKLDVARQREYARLIHASGQHLLQVVNGILDMSKIESGMFEIFVEPLRVAPLIDACCDMIAGQASKRGIAVLRELPSGLPEITADRRAIKQILLNLLSNAVKFTNKGGTVRVGASLRDGGVALAVADTGIGIAREYLARLGTPFVQADAGYERRYEGTGLGLSLVKGLAALHGGQLAIESTPGIGTTVTVTLPLRVSAETFRAATVGASPDSSLHEKKELQRA